MFSKILKSRAFIAVTAAATTAAVVGGIAYAVTVVPPNPSDLYYACVSTAGVVKSSTIKLNVQPTSCPTATDTVRSWNAQGTQGMQGLPGNTGAQGDPGPQGAAAPAKRVRVIRVTGPTTISGPNSTANGNFGGPVDVRDCASYGSIQVEFGAPNNITSVGVTGQSIMPGDTGTPTISAFVGSTNIGGGNLRASMSPALYGPAESMQLRISVSTSNAPVSATITDVWITCVTF